MMDLRSVVRARHGEIQRGEHAVRVLAIRWRSAAIGEDDLRGLEIGKGGAVTRRGANRSRRTGDQEDTVMASMSLREVRDPRR